MENIRPLIARSSPHVHTQFCDGKSTAEDMVLSALEKRFVSLGFSSHAKQNFHREYSLNPYRESLYIAEVKRLRETYAGQLRVWLGMERDLYSFAERTPFDYVIGALHYVETPEGAILPVDASADLMAEQIAFDYWGDGLRMAEDYFAAYGKYISEYKPDIIAHFDLPTKYNRGGSLFDTDDPRYRKAATEALDLAITGCRLMEVNVGGIIRAKTLEPYPALPLLSYWRALGGEVILSSDCHHAAQLNTGYEEGLRHIRAAGYKKAALLGRRQELFEWHELP